VVISDRYVDSSLAYQGAGRTLPVAEISWLSSWATGGLKPDLVVLLDVDPGVGLNRVDSRGEGADRLESESRAFHERVRYAFLDLAAADPKRYLVLDAARPIDELSTAVSDRLTTLLGAAEPAHPAPASTDLPPTPDFEAPDLTAVPDRRVGPDDRRAAASATSATSATSADNGAPAGDRPARRADGRDGEPPLEEMAELIGINDDETPDGPTHAGRR
jgi:dTMP kinase